MQLVGDGLVQTGTQLAYGWKDATWNFFCVNVGRLGARVVVWRCLVDGVGRLGGGRRPTSETFFLSFFFFCCVSVLYGDRQKRKTKNKRQKSRQKKETEDIGVERPRSVSCITSSVLSENVGNSSHKQETSSEHSGELEHGPGGSGCLQQT